MVDLRFGAAAAANVVSAGGREGAGRARGNHYVTSEGGGKGAVSRRRLTPLLRMLVNDPAFQFSVNAIEVPGRAPTLVRDLFVQFPRIDAGRHFNAFHGYWGFLADAKEDQHGALWLNSGGSWREFSIVVPTELVAAFRQRFQVADLEDFAGAYALVFAPLQVSGNQKPFIALEDLDSIAVYQP
ncbi:hypothetical protein [Cupriavidus pauculus]|uniref:hypothetical protein n=1 Tax=Cupriavidus pauculus TaxID=82633 RepID=UPI0012FD2177|nr:hypothetical protein [Cupriavidus pauculus]MBY4730526.1 hypothetical protein [Cupriavidus pauculus]